jgi:hypothetical protein
MQIHRAAGFAIFHTVATFFLQAPATARRINGNRKEARSGHLRERV